MTTDHPEVPATPPIARPRPRSLRQRIVALAAAVVVFSMYPTIAYALPENTQEWYWFTGCNALTQSAEYTIDCDGHHQYWGSSSGAKWLLTIKDACPNCTSEFCQTHGPSYSEYCPTTNTWKTVSATDFWNANCSCS